MNTAIPGAGSSGVLSIREAAWVLGVDRSEICRLIRVGVLPTIRRRSRLVVPAHASASPLLPASGERESATNDEEIFEEVAARLDDLEGAPIVTLFDLVTREGPCMWIDGGTEEPTWTGEKATDRELAATLCAGCLVADECWNWSSARPGSPPSGCGVRCPKTTGGPPTWPGCSAGKLGGESR